MVVHICNHTSNSLQSRSSKNIFSLDRERSVTGTRAERDCQCACLHWKKNRNIGSYRERSWVDRDRSYGWISTIYVKDHDASTVCETCKKMADDIRTVIMHGILATSMYLIGHLLCVQKPEVWLEGSFYARLASSKPLKWTLSVLYPHSSIWRQIL